MCGIVGLFIKDGSLQPRLGALAADMLATMCERGPDSAGFAVYGPPEPGKAKLTVQSADPDKSFAGLDAALANAVGTPVALARKSNHAVLTVAADKAQAARAAIEADHPALRIMSTGETMEIYKDVGWPTEVSRRFHLENMTGSHAIGHTRMATESTVTTLGAHPYSTGSDECLVHNGSLSNHNNLRRTLKHDGFCFATENDTEVAAAYLTWRMRQGMGLGEALERSLQDFDGFFTFVVGTRNGFGVLRDPIASKPAVMAETEQYVAFGSEYRTLVVLPGIDAARIWEPEPATVYFWGR